MQAELIYWQDATSCDEWLGTTVDLGLMDVATMGFVIEETKQHVILASTMAGDGDYCMTFTIPKAWIIKRCKLKIPSSISKVFI